MQNTPNIPSIMSFFLKTEGVYSIKTIIHACLIFVHSINYIFMHYVSKVLVYTLNIKDRSYNKTMHHRNYTIILILIGYRLLRPRDAPVTIKITK